MSYEFSEQLAMCSTLDEIASTMENRVKGYGFAGFAYWTHLKVPVSELSGHNSFMVVRGPAYLKAFEAIYFGKRLFDDDPIVEATTQRTTPFSTKEIRDLDRARAKTPNRRKRWIYALEQRFGFSNDIYIPVHTPLRVQVFYVYFLGDKPENEQILQDVLPQLHLDAALFSNSAIDFVVMGEENEAANILFSVREQECLTWMAKGRSNAEIGRILDISERTVKFHVKNIMEKLRAENRTEAVAIAARSGWINN